MNLFHFNFHIHFPQHHKLHQSESVTWGQHLWAVWKENHAHNPCYQSAACFCWPQLSDSISVAPWDLWHSFHPQSYPQLFLSLVQTGTTWAPAYSFEGPRHTAVLSVLPRDMAMRQPRIWAWERHVMPGHRENTTIWSPKLFQNLHETCHTT